MAWRRDADESTWRRQNRRGERRRRRPTTDFDERIAPRNKASKLIRALCGSRATGEQVRDKGKGARTGDEPARLRVGSKPLNGNPGRGCGMKQARKADGGGSRREVEKT